jgi:hypothetical protein
VGFSRFWLTWRAARESVLAASSALQGSVSIAAVIVLLALWSLGFCWWVRGLFIFSSARTPRLRASPPLAQRLHRFRCMKTRLMTLPELMMIAGTRVALGAGLGLLLGSRLSDNARRGAGWTLLGLGAVTTIPLAMNVIGKTNHA